ncbi:hypothetical protein JW906_16305, partial [bacterium]|nr:hypothetical protein [bacterium]
AYVSVSNDAGSIYWNPAGMMELKQAEISSMYSNLFYDAQYSYFGAVLPRILENPQNALTRFLAGPNTAFGLGWVGLGMVGFQQTTATGVYLGDFNIGENALLFGWAREETGEWGVFRYGLNAKWINQNFSNLRSSEDMGIGKFERDWTGGMDAGLSFQPINMPGLKIVSVKYLLPLRMGMAVQNILQPGWEKEGGGSDPFPRVFRYGLSYRWILRDWISPTWHGFYDAVKGMQILTAVDHESFKGAKGSTSLGAELFMPVVEGRLHLLTRAGYNDRHRETSLGAGLYILFGRNACARMDYALCMHPDLVDDNRFSLSIQVGADRGIPFFRKLSRREDLSEARQNRYLMRILAEYPDPRVSESAELLISRSDSLHAGRYYVLTSGRGKAQWLLAEARSLLKQGKDEKARKKAEDAAREYAPLFLQAENQLKDNELLDFGEALIIAGLPKDAVMALAEVTQEGIRHHYLTATAQKQMGNWDHALASYEEAVKCFEQEQDFQNMASLSLLGMGEMLMMKKQYRAALTALEVLLSNPHSILLGDEYPRFPSYADFCILDDAQFLAGLCTLQIQDPRESVHALLMTNRLYPQSVYGRLVLRESERLIRIYQNAEWNQLEEAADGLLSDYQSSHGIPRK